MRHPIVGDEAVFDDMNNTPNAVENEITKNGGQPDGNQKRSRVVDLVAYILCFIIAFGVWVYVVNTENEEYEYTFTDVVVKFEGVTHLQNVQGLSIINEYEAKVNITVKGYRSEIMKYASEDFFAHVDVDSISSDGIHSLDVIAELPDGKMSIVSTSPSAINVSVDWIEKKNVPIEVNLHYDIADTFTLHDPIPEIGEVEIVGPKSRVEEVAYAEVEYVLGSVTTSTNFKAPIKLYDIGGNEIENPYIKPSVGEVKVQVKVTTEKAVPFAATYTAKDQDKYDYKVIFEPASLMLVGDPAIFEWYKALSVSLGDITDASEEPFRVVDIGIALPNGVNFKEGEAEKQIVYRVEKTMKALPSEDQ